MEKRCSHHLEAVINSFNFYRTRFFKKPLYKALWPKDDFLREIAHPLLDRKESPPKIFSRLFILELALSITKVSTRSGCHTWDTSLVSHFFEFFGDGGGFEEKFFDETSFEINS